MKKLIAIEFGNLLEESIDLWDAASLAMEEMELDNGCLFTEDYEEWVKEGVCNAGKAELEDILKLLEFLRKNKIDCIVQRF